LLKCFFTVGRIVLGKLNHSSDSPLDPASTAINAEGSNGNRANWIARMAGAILFYSRVPLPPWWQPSFEGIAALAPVVGLGIGGLLVLGDVGLGYLEMPVLTRSALIVALWVWLTGGLHLDGAMDTADGLAVPDQQRRLEVMADSRAGAFGVMAAVAILGLKTLALTDIATARGITLVLAAGLGRWGQVAAIARYSYLKTHGKGALHKSTLRLPQDIVLGLIAIGLVIGGYGWWQPANFPLLIGLSAIGIGLTVAIGAWLNQRLGGHTGDTYGAIVEWTETLVLCLATVLV
jgi:adenosylcobinamide-GDP ribazoletransferase